MKNKILDITEMYARIPWELVADPWGSAEHNLGSIQIRDRNFGNSCWMFIDFDVEL